MKSLTLTFVLSLILIATAATTATAGKNSGGALVVHTNDAYTYRLNPCYFFDGDVPQECELLNTQTNNTPEYCSL